ncbi:MAG: Ig domain-containing protein [Streptosporangiaceae bacterium]
MAPVTVRQTHREGPGDQDGAGGRGYARAGSGDQGPAGGEGGQDERGLGHAAKDAQKLSYYGGVLKVTGTAGQPISASAIVIGGQAPLTIFAGIDGTVPSWLALGVSGNNTVSLGGTPSAPGTWRFDVEVQDAKDEVVSIPVSLTVS